MATATAVEAQHFDEEPKPTLGDRLRRSRKNAGISTESMSESVGRGTKTISRWENDDTIPSWTEIEKWAAVTRVRVGWLATRCPQCSAVIGTNPTRLILIVVVTLVVAFTFGGIFIR